MPVERQVSHMIDVARAMSLTAEDDDAIQLLQQAESLAPHLPRSS
jgi:hypothetical protein